MKLESRETPIVDAQARMMKEVNRLNVYTGQSCEVISAEEARSLERRLAHAVKALEHIAAHPLYFVKANATDALRDIAESRK